MKDVTQKSAGHTPGPWTADKSPYSGWKFEGGFLGRIVAENGTQIYAGPSSFHAIRGKNEAECDANARLIAAAPELLEALAELLTALDESDSQGFMRVVNAKVAARAILAKVQP